MSFAALREELLGLFSRGVSQPLSDEAFTDLALRVFRYQSLSVPAYAAFLGRRELNPASVTRVEQIPFLPTQAFKAAVLVSGTSGAERVFRTSGTTQGHGERGKHHVRDLSLYRASLLPNFEAHLFPDGERLPLFCLLPSPDRVLDSSLSFMLGEVGKSLGIGASFFVDPEGRMQMEKFCGALDEISERGFPALIAGTAFAFVQMLDWTSKVGWSVSLAPGSRIMETGGYKGRTRIVAREKLYSGLRETLEVPLDHIVSEYGMTELLSQFYEPVLVEGGGGAVGPVANGDLGDRYHRGPPWVKTLVLDPLTLEPLPVGAVGILAHLDLANLGSVSAILTEDLGRTSASGFRLMGRPLGAEPRGCSLLMEDFIASVSEGL